MKYYKFFIIGFTLLITSSLYSQDLVYRPINPSFSGGNPYNANWLLSQAQAQDKLTQGTDVTSGFNQDPLANFEQTLKRQILNELSQQLIADVFGESSFVTEGRYEIGNFLIDISPGSDGLNIQIIDNLTGSESNILIPYF